MSDSDFDTLSDEAFSDGEEVKKAPKKSSRPSKHALETKRPKKPQPEQTAAWFKAEQPAEKKADQKRPPMAPPSNAKPVAGAILVASPGFHLKSEKGRQKGRRGLWPAQCFGAGASWGGSAPSAS